MSQLLAVEFRPPIAMLCGAARRPIRAALYSILLFYCLLPAAGSPRRLGRPAELARWR
jgi:hypothetical protein